MQYAAIAVAIRPVEQALAALAGPHRAGLEVVRHEITAFLLIQPLEMPLQIGMAFHLLRLQALVAVAIEPFKQLLQPPLVALQFRLGLGLGAHRR